jgi:hypothetical protein
MSDAQDQYKESVVFDFADEAIIAHAVFPEFTEKRAVQGFTMLRGSSSVATLVRRKRRMRR